MVQGLRLCPSGAGGLALIPKMFSAAKTMKKMPFIHMAVHYLLKTLHSEKIHKLYTVFSPQTN